MGKAAFTHISDRDGLLQVYLRLDELGDDFLAYKEYDIGDIIGIKGRVFKTRTGEISLHLSHIELLSKSLLPLPEKFHGLKDPDLRYRQRYVDLIINPEVKKTFVLRSKIISAIREYLDGLDFIEVETPVLNNIAGGASARPFITKHNTLDLNMYLRIALELNLKRLIVGGFDRVYEIGRVFRNEGMSVKHNPEFTLMELYQAYTDYYGMMDITEGIYRYVLDKVIGTRFINYQGIEIDFEKPFERITMIDAVKKYLDIDFNNTDTNFLENELKAKGIAFNDGESWGKLLYAAFDQKIEPFLINPTFVLDYPVEVSPLTKKKPTDGRLTERFEFFITSREMGNAYSELNDPIDQKERFMQQVKAKAAGDEEAQDMDEDFVTALEYGMPPTGGLGIGIDRMVMLLTDSASIRDVLLFPTMKPRK
jgi:lysyl-tRNA synthetase class 2